MAHAWINIVYIKDEDVLGSSFDVRGSTFKAGAHAPAFSVGADGGRTER
jgi:hypothetical protein